MKELERKTVRLVAGSIQRDGAVGAADACSMTSAFEIIPILDENAAAILRKTSREVVPSSAAEYK